VVVSVSGAVALGVTLFFLHRNGRTTLGAAVVAVLFGFLLASTGVAPTIQSALDGISHAAAGIR
jgi:hypothetical protein